MNSLGLMYNAYDDDCQRIKEYDDVNLPRTDVSAKRRAKRASSGAETWRSGARRERSEVRSLPCLIRTRNGKFRRYSRDIYETL